MNYFVFVVCGEKEHVNELNFSLKFLKKISKHEIIVITDSNRNECVIEHDHVINVRTQADLTNHQASIYLKTSLLNYLPDGHCYCYLDGDVIAINKEVDQIFKFRKGVINFSKDHCRINEFSPHALNCGCIEGNEKQEAYFNEKLSMLFGKINISNPFIKKQSEDISNIFEKYKKQPIKNIFKILYYLLFRHVLPVTQFNIESKYSFNKSDKCWYNSDREIILFDFPFYEKKLWVDYGIIWNKQNKYWETKEGGPVRFLHPKCHHLTDYLNSKYSIDIPDEWQHWNGGVFLFDENSREFLDYWHKITMDEFHNPYTKIRDQGTLAVCVWKFGIQKMRTLPVRFNFITEKENDHVRYESGKGYTYNDFKTIFEPAFLHVYHHWANNEWSIWQSVMEQAKKLNIVE